MSLHLLGLTFVTLAVLLEAVGQLALKHGAEGARGDGGCARMLPSSAWGVVCAPRGADTYS